MRGGGREWVGGEREASRGGERIGRRARRDVGGGELGRMEVRGRQDGVGGGRKWGAELMGEGMRGG